MRCITIALLATLTIGIAFSSAGNSANDSGAKLPTTQLPRTVRPSHYDISLVPDAAALTFAGKVSIDIEVVERTDTITLQAADLAFKSAALLGRNISGAVGQPKISVDTQAQTASFTFDKPLEKGTYKLALDYTGKIGTQAYGLFAIDYQTKSGAKRALFTQFENSDARRMIPSWDEPAYKATFALEATVPQNQLAISNMPIAQKSDAGGGRSRVRFGESPKMSTYLLFFGVGDLERITAKVGPTEVGIVTQSGIADQGRFALDSAAVVLKEYNEYFGVPYPLPKLDNIASPGRSQFFSAMENWGAIYTFEHAILLDPAISTQADKQSAFSVAAHEMAHQWFGDLVTMSWWDDLWLNEGFATWMAGRTTAKLHPEWDTLLNNVDGREGAMSRDSMATTHSVVQKVATVEQASQAFDSITYQKGSAVIRMIEDYVGADVWRDGVRQYIKKHAYGNTANDDLWQAIEVAAKKPILAIAHDFTLQPGVPLLRVGEPTCNNNTATVQLSQAEFSKDQPQKKALAWRVPVVLKPANGASVRALVTDGKATVSVPGCNAVVVNSGQAGYYRTLYSPGHFNQIKTSFDTLPAVDQLGILSDTWQLGLAGYRPTSDALDLSGAVTPKSHPKIWRAVASIFDTINDLYREDPARAQKFRAFAIGRLAPIFAQVGWTAKAGEPDSVAILREELIGTLSSLGDETTIAEARRRYGASKTDLAAIPGPLRRTILGVVARHADAKTWDQLRQEAKNEKSPLVRDKLYSLLSSSEDKALAQRALDLSITDEPGATNSSTMIGRVANLHPDLAFDFSMANLAAVDARVDSSSRSGYYPGIASGSSDPAMIAKIKKYADAHIRAEARRDAETAVARINYRIKLKNERLPAIDQWLARKS